MVSFATIKTFATLGIKLYKWDFLIPAFAILAVLIVAKIFGFLNIGNLGHGVKKTQKIENSPLNGKNIIFLGSSVTKGMAAQGKSFVDMVAAATGANFIKEAVSGTTLIDNGKKSYVARLKTIDKNAPCDLFVCQLSTNDATYKKPIGTVGESKDIDSFDTQTVCGAIEYIIAYAKETWNCPVAFYTSPEYASAHYLAMREALIEIAAKWDIDIIDLWTNSSINKKSFFAMNDSIHPTKKGYQRWTPVFADSLAAIIEGKKPVVGTPAKSAEVLKKKGTTKLVLNIVKYVVLIALTAAIALGLAGFKTLNGAGGLIKKGNNEKYDPQYQAVNENSPLKDKTILFLGSSVTQGYAAKKISFVEYIAQIDGVNAIKEVWPATTVANRGGTLGSSADDSYNPRLRKYTAEDKIDALVIQLSSNDSTSGAPLGDLSESFNSADIDDTSYTGGMESLIAYTRETWGEETPIIIYANPQFRGKTYYNAAAYKAMVDQTKLIAEKWGVDFLNMWDDAEFNAVSDDQYFFWMSDVVHPTKAGYLEWWTPAFQEILYNHFG